MTEIAKIIGERMRAYRAKAGMSQETLAERAGLHSTYIGQLERGEKNATIESLEKIARVLNVSFEALFSHIVSGTAENGAAEQCYSLIATQSEKEQRAMLDLIQKAIDYKNL